jgi:HSP20 family protein
MKVGPDGKPEIHEFGNVKPQRNGLPHVQEEREPLVDVVETDECVQVVAELPGVEKEDIKLSGTETTLTIAVDNPQRRYFKEVSLPVKVRVREAKSQYKNGVLEVSLPKADGDKSSRGESINVE